VTIRALTGGEPPDAVAIGLSGFDTPDERVRSVALRIRDATRASSVTVASDVVAWHLTALAGRPGVVVVAGTGSVALAADGRGGWARADGWGSLLGDTASGFAVGRAGLASALEAYDGRGGSDALLDRAIARWGPAPGIAASIQGAASPVAEVASFAPAVADAAHAGDPRARAIWRATGVALARTAMAAWTRAGIGDVPDRVHIAGSLARSGGLLLDPCAEALPTGVLPEVVEADPTDGVMSLAAGMGRLFPGLVVTAGPAR
jgi:N-acetylglucosamine kinase-like BadF-type ATPase